MVLKMNKTTLSPSMSALLRLEMKKKKISSRRFSSHTCCTPSQRYTACPLPFSRAFTGHKAWLFERLRIFWTTNYVLTIPAGDDSPFHPRSRPFSPAIPRITVTSLLNGQGGLSSRIWRTMNFCTQTQNSSHLPAPRLSPAPGNQDTSVPSRHDSE